MKRTFQDIKTFRTDEQLDGTANSLSQSLERSYAAWNNTQADTTNEQYDNPPLDQKRVFHQVAQVYTGEQDGQVDKNNQRAFSDFNSLT